MKKYIKVFTVWALSFCSLLFMITIKTSAQNRSSNYTLAAEIQRQLNGKAKALNYPQSVLRFYTHNNFQPAWIKPQSGTGQTWQGMLMLDCVMAFGLSHDDYHPKELTYDLLHNILDTPGKVQIGEQARYDIIMTDAVITLLNHLHYGKLNPDYPSHKIDNGLDKKFLADNYLVDALAQKDLMTAIADVQPKTKLYIDLQHRMQLLKGKYQDDCYEVPEAEVRKIAINMERLRWADIEESTYILINIPTYTLTYQLPDTAYQFKVIVGKPTNPTPTLRSAINYFTTGPEWKVPAKIFAKELLPKAMADTGYLENNHYAIYDKSGKYVGASKSQLAAIKKNPGNYYARQSAGCDNALGAVVFRFANTYNVYLHDTPEQRLFNKADRDFSHGCIRLEQADKLGKMLLQNDHAANLVGSFTKAMTRYQTKTFKLKAPVPLHITYLTCAIDEWGLVTNYTDIYNLDKSLEMALYNVSEPLSLR